MPAAQIQDIPAAQFTQRIPEGFLKVLIDRILGHANHLRIGISDAIPILNICRCVTHKLPAINDCRNDLVMLLPGLSPHALVLRSVHPDLIPYRPRSLPTPRWTPPGSGRKHESPELEPPYDLCSRAGCPGQGNKSRP